MQDKRELFGWFINESCYPLLEQNTDLDALQALRKHYSFYSNETRSKVIDLHLKKGVSQELKYELLNVIVSCIATSEQAERKTAQVLIENILQCFGETYNFVSWSSLKEAINISPKRNKKLDFVLARAVGAWSVNDSKLILKLLEDLLAGDSSYISLNRDAIDEAICRGAGDLVVSLLLSINNSYIDIPKQRRSPIISLFKDRVFKGKKTIKNTLDQKTNIKISSLLSLEYRRRLAEWFYSIESEEPSNILEILIGLSYDLPDVQEKVKQLINKLGNKANKTISKMPFVPEYVEQCIQMTGNDKESRKSLVKNISNKARTTASEEDIARLVEKAKDCSKAVAVAAAQELLTFVGKQKRPDIDDWLSILESSNFSGVRGYCLDALNKLIEQDITDNHLMRVWINLSKPRKSKLQETQKVSDLVVGWINKNQRVSSTIVELIDQLLQFLHENHNGRIAGSLFDAFKTITRIQERIEMCPMLIKWICNLLILIDIKTVKNGQSEVAQVLRLINDIEPGFLRRVVEKECPYMRPKERSKNVCAVVEAIKKCGGKELSLLDDIQRSSWCPPDASALISKFQLKS